MKRLDELTEWFNLNLLSPRFLCYILTLQQMCDFHILPGK